jgi:hypothetical protein
MRFMAYLLVLAAMTAAGCTTSRGKFTRPNYETLYYSQPAADVQTAMGKPSKQEPDRWEYMHQKPYYKAVIFLQDGQVVKTEWYDDPWSGPSPAPGARKAVPLKSGPKHKHTKQPSNPPTSAPELQEPSGSGN